MPHFPCFAVSLIERGLLSEFFVLGGVVFVTEEEIAIFEGFVLFSDVFGFGGMPLIVVGADCFPAGIADRLVVELFLKLIARSHVHA